MTEQQLLAIASISCFILAGMIHAPKWVWVVAPLSVGTGAFLGFLISKAMGF